LLRDLRALRGKKTLFNMRSCKMKNKIGFTQPFLKRNLKERAGFSIVELLVVLAIISIVLGISIPRLNRSSGATNLKTTTESIRQLLESAKTHAITQNTNCSAIYDSSSGKVYLARKDIDDVDNDADVDELITIEKGIEVPNGITLYFTADDQVEFGSWGGVENPDDGITVSNSSIGKQRSISINATTGYIQVS